MTVATSSLSPANENQSKIIFAPSVLACDFTHLADEIAAIEAAGADWLHLDVMDGHFVPNLTFGPLLVQALRKCTKLPLDAHLMISEPERWIDAFADAGCDHITIHAEAAAHLHRTLSAIRERGVQAGISINPATPPDCIAYITDLIDQVLVMSVDPGFGGQRFIESVIPKIVYIRELEQKYNCHLHIAVDGGIDSSNIGKLAAAGADVFVAGSAIFGSKDYRAAIESMRSVALAALSVV
ncbi:MAG: ribulose-phosphate 3-epimerase [Deltaproteobacteria bacterium]|nr:ribulose-phosphate 3-epimerase [Deltaproteobacteria bacterium]